MPKCVMHTRHSHDRHAKNHQPNMVRNRNNTPLGSNRAFSKNEKKKKERKSHAFHGNSAVTVCFLQLDRAKFVGLSSVRCCGVLCCDTKAFYQQEDVTFPWASAR